MGPLSEEDPWDPGSESPDRLTHSQQAPLLPTWGSKACFGEGFNPQDLLRDSHHLRALVGNWMVLGVEENWLEPETKLRGPWDSVT